MRHVAFVVATLIGLAPLSCMAQVANCPECVGTQTLAPSTFAVTVCSDCASALADSSLPPLTCEGLGGAIDGTQCKLADGRLCALDNLDACGVNAGDGEDWGEEPASGRATDNGQDGGQ